MLNKRWKLLIVSIVIYQAILTWSMFSLIDTTAYLARTECGEHCTGELFGYILTNQGGSDTALRFVVASGLLVLVNVAVWIKVALSKPSE